MIGLGFTEEFNPVRRPLGDGHYTPASCNDLAMSRSGRKK
jgi:hypothetical protein